MASPAAWPASWVGGADISLDQRWKSSRSFSGTPNSSQITDSGSCRLKDDTRSARPSGSTASRSSSVISWIRGRSASMRRGVNSLDTSLRSRVWSGGSACSMLVPMALRPMSGHALR